MDRYVSWAVPNSKLNTVMNPLVKALSLIAVCLKKH